MLGSFVVQYADRPLTRDTLETLITSGVDVLFKSAHEKLQIIHCSAEMKTDSASCLSTMYDPTLSSIEQKATNAPATS